MDLSQQKRRRGDSFLEDPLGCSAELGGMVYHSSVVVDTPVVCEVGGSSLFSPPSSGAHPPPVPFDDMRAVGLQRRKSCSELFEEDMPAGMERSLSGFSCPHMGDTEPFVTSHRNYPLLSLSSSVGFGIGDMPRDPPPHDCDSRRGTLSSLGSNAESGAPSLGRKVKRQLTEPPRDPRTPYREQLLRCLAEDAVAIRTPQAVLSKFHSSGTGKDDWGFSVVASEACMQRFHVLFADRDGMKPIAGNPRSIAFKSTAKIKKKKALMRRMSQNRFMLFSPGASVCKRIRGPKNSPEQEEAMAEEWTLADKICQAEGHGDDSQSVAESAPAAALHVVNELNFKGVVVGGIYENCFDDNVPVVSAPSTYDNRVVNVSFGGDNTLFLHIYFPNTKSMKAVNLGRSWSCYRTSTGAFLVTKTDLIPHRRMVCYYLPKHPLRWAAASPRELHDCSIGSIVAFDPDSADFRYQGQGGDALGGSEVQDMEHDYHSDVEDEPHLCRVLVSSMDMSAESAKGDFSLTKEAQGYGSRHAFSLQDDNSFENGLVLPCERRLITDSDCSRDYSEVLESSMVDWNNPIVASCLCEYLSPMDCSTYSAVSKSWALAYFKFRAHNLSLPGCCDYLDKARWIRFMTKYNTGAFLSSGACKSVYRVRCGEDRNDASGAASPWQAVSVMDINDMIDREVGDSISRELEISMVTSSLVSLNISPNFIQVYSVFESKYSPSSNFWKPASSDPDIIGCASTIPARSLQSTVQKEVGLVTTGRFQYIRMELCSGGDMEGLIRGRSVLSCDAIVNYFFQMCFSLYSCRERLSMRHYDIKLLNFFCTSAASLPMNTGPFGSCARRTHLRIGFGEHQYYLPLHYGCDDISADIVKLADFGTSVLGSNTLGCPIGVHQVCKLPICLQPHRNVSFTRLFFSSQHWRTPHRSI